MPRANNNEKLHNSMQEVLENVNTVKAAISTQCIDTEYLKQELKDLKEIAICQNKMMEDSKKQAKELKNTIFDQNKVIVSLLSEIKVMTKSLVTVGQTSTKYSNSFPISTEEQLKEFEDEISEQTRDDMVHTIRTLINPGGFTKNLQNILTTDMVLLFNVDGKQGKKRLLDYPKFVDLLYRTHFGENLTKNEFLNNFRKVLRLTKNRVYKGASIKARLSSSEIGEDN